MTWRLGGGGGDAVGLWGWAAGVMKRRGKKMGRRMRREKRGRGNNKSGKRKRGVKQ